MTGLLGKNFIKILRCAQYGLSDPSQARDDRAIGGKFYADTSLRSVWGLHAANFYNNIEK
jgi:hypothetical protein